MEHHKHTFMSSSSGWRMRTLYKLMFAVASAFLKFTTFYCGRADDDKLSIGIVRRD